MKTLLNKISLIMVFLVWVATNAFAQNQIIETRTGSQINDWALSSNAVTITCPYFNPVAGVTLRNDDPVMDVVLEFTDTKNNFFPFDWKVKIDYTIKLWANSSSSTPSPTAGSVTINYDRNNPYTDIDVRSYKNFTKAELSITTVTFTKYINGSAVNSTVIPTNGDMMDWTDVAFSLRYTPDYVFSTASTSPVLKPAHSPHSGYTPQYFSYCPSASSGVVIAPNNEIKISWATQIGAESYDLEWVFIDIPEGQPFNSLYYFDWRNAVRINVSEPFAKIPLAYPRGKIVYRVRTVSRWWYQNAYYRKEGEWTRVGTYSSNPNLDNTTFDGAITNGYYFNWCGLEPGKNWSYAASYTEGGKRAEQISFMDATGRDRKSISYNYADDTVAIVNRTYYDKQGRPVIEILPTPVQYEGNSYYASFTDAFDASDFDADNLYANGFSGLPSNHPTSQYYSTANPFLTAATNYKDKQKFGFIPTSDNYGFVQIKYKNDGSGRTDKTMLPGATHRISKGHETKNMYGTVGGQNELDRLFGNEVGFSEHYTKNMSIDQNGVTSISYVDGSGRTVATALAGNPAIQNLNAIPHASQTVGMSLMDNLTYGDDGSVTTTKELIVPVAGEYVFNYALAGTTYDMPCFQSKNCLYDVYFTVTKENGASVTLTNVPAGGTFAGSFLGITAQSSISFKANFTEPGKYTVTKITRASAGMEAYITQLKQHITAAGPGENNPCIPQVIPETPCYDCETQCEQAYSYEISSGAVTGMVYVDPSENSGTPPIQYTGSTALAALFPNDILLDDANHIQLIQAEITRCKLECNNADVTLNISDCDIMYQVLLRDMSPGGQYMDNTPVTAGNPTATQADKDRWLNMFVDATTKQYLINWANIGPNPTWEELRQVWTSQMAQLLVTLHPEYCQYDYYCNDVANTRIMCCSTPSYYWTSGTYDTQSHNGHEDAFGISGGFFDPLMLSGIPSAYSISDCTMRDPYFCDKPTEYGTMQGYLQNYIAKPSAWGGGYYSIWDVLDNAAASETANPLDPQEVAVKEFFDELADRFNDPLHPYHISKYLFFRGYYSARKKQIIQEGFPAWSKDNCKSCASFTKTACVNCVDANVVPDPDCHECWLSSMDENADGYVDEGYTKYACVGAGSMDISGFQIRYPHIGALTNPEDVTQTDLCASQCQAYALSWINQMTDAWIGCTAPPVIGFTQAMRDDLYEDFYNYCMGQCTPLSSLGQVPDFNTPTAQAQLQTIANAFETTYSAPRCPTHFFVNTIAYGTAENDIPEPNKLSCQCANLAEILTAGGSTVLINHTVYPNPVHYNRYGVSLASVINPTNAVAWINDVLLQLGSTAPPVTTADLASWLQICDANTTHDINDVASTDLPTEMSCSPEPYDYTDCEMLNSALDDMNMWANFNSALETYLAHYRDELYSTCLTGLGERETFTVSYTLEEFQYTLFYYDRAGNLIKSVPPAGVEILNQSQTDATLAYRKANYTTPTYASSASFKRPNHFMATNYKYNSLDQVTEKNSPDAGQTKYWYDFQGRLAISQNAKQAPTKYSYTRYDGYGRITEVGQLTCTTAVSQTAVQNLTWLNGIFFSTGNLATREQVTLTRYDEQLASLGIPEQKNLRNRVASSFYFETVPSGSPTNNYVHATHYSYDIHGNVVQAIQDFPFLNQFGMRFASTEYEYELVSGNMKKVSYRKGNVDQFYHRYKYDNNNNLITVQTSRDGAVWETEAEYFYSLTGDMYREETGAKKVQGADYAGTIHGWHKAANATRLDPTVDMGRDGRHVLATADGHNQIARDAFGYALTYYNGDYTKSGTALASFEHANMFSSAIGTSIMGIGSGNNPKGQFNGNIAASVTALRYDYPGTNPPVELGIVYGYDQLYRLNTARSFMVSPGTAFSWTGVTTAGNWDSDYTYDANGNIKKLKRKDHQAVLMDNLTYTYDTIANNRLASNRLFHVKDAGTTGGHPEDFEITTNPNYTGITTSNNFTYDALGNLKTDVSEAIGDISWNVYGKVKKIDRSSGTKPDLEYYYDAAGRRILKVVKPNAGTSAQNTWIYTVFTYNAGGQLMGEYEIASQSGYRLKLKGRHIYGSAKKGKTLDDIQLRDNAVSEPSFVTLEMSSAGSVLASNKADTTVYSRMLGKKQYEFSNHLGNILVTTDDRRVAIDDGTYTYNAGTGVLTKVNSTPDKKLDYYLPHVLTVSDYYPGGAPMPGRTLEAPSCTTTTTQTVTTLHNVNFSALGNNGYIASVNSSIANTSGVLVVSKNSTLTTPIYWGTRMQSYTLTAGTVYTLDYTFAWGSCSATPLSYGVRVINVGTGVTDFNTVSALSGSNSVQFSVTTGGSYYIEFYVLSTGNKACAFSIDNVLLSYVATYASTTNCTTGTALQYAWGHNGQLKDNEIYGKGNAYSAEYWEYDARLLRRWNTDPVEYAWQSPYACFNNNPIFYADPQGLEGTNPGGPPVDEYGNPLAGNMGDIATTKDESGNLQYWINDGQGNWNMINPYDASVNDTRPGDTEFWDWMDNVVGKEGFDQLQKEIYIAKVFNETHNESSGLAYGPGVDGIRTLPIETSRRLSRESQAETWETLKTLWAMKESGVDPSSIGYYFIPPLKALYLEHRARCITSKGEATELVIGVALEVGIAWFVRFVGTRKVHSVQMGRAKEAESFLARTANGGKNLTNSQYRAITSLEKQIAIHEKKLSDYIKNPAKYDNKGFLKNAPNDKVRDAIINSRIKHLQQEINTFKNNIQKIVNGG